MIRATFATSGASIFGSGTFFSAHRNSACATVSLSISCSSSEPYATRSRAPISARRSSNAEVRSAAALKMQTTTIANRTKITMPNISGDISVFDLEQLSNREKRQQIQSRGNFQKALALGFVEKRMRIRRLNDAEGRQDDDRQRCDYPSAHPRLRGQRSNLLPEALANAHDLGQALDNDGEAAADLGLHAHRDDQQAQVVVGHALEHLLHRARQRKTEPRLLDDG